MNAEERQWVWLGLGVVLGSCIGFLGVWGCLWLFWG